MSETKLTYQSALLSDKNKSEPIAVAISPIVVDTEKPIMEMLRDIEGDLLKNNISLMSALKKVENLPDSSEVGTIHTILQMYRAFESGKFVMVSCDRYPCGDGTRDHCLTIRFTPPKD